MSCALKDLIHTLDILNNHVELKARSWYPFSLGILFLCAPLLVFTLVPKLLVIHLATILVDNVTKFQLCW